MMIPGKTLARMAILLTLSGSLAALEPVAPIEPVKNINLAMVELGKKLYFDPRLSKFGLSSRFQLCAMLI
jgi:cytochrome c peroxidase